VLAGQVEHGAARHEHCQPRRPRQQLADDHHRIVEVLGVVEHQQELPRREETRQRLQLLLFGDALDRERAEDRVEE
jgi:hypothetical protein